jgi:predicted phage terminase large subunit-like protein
MTQMEAAMLSNFNQLLRYDVLTFANRAHLELHGTELNKDPYLELLAFDVERIIRGRMRRYVCNLPPGHGKTTIFSVTLAALLLGHNPSARILVVSYGEDPATDISRKIRAILQAHWYGTAFPRAKLAKDQKAARDFGTIAGGHVYARSIDGAVTGIRCEYLIVDDPVQIRDSGDLAQLKWVNERFDTDLVTRLNNRRTGTIVVVHHRLNLEDLTGHLLPRKRWAHRSLPLIAPEDRDYRLKNGIWHRKKGEILRPDAYGAEDIAELRENTGPPGFGPLYQQTFDGPDVVQIRRSDFVIEPIFRRPAVPFLLSIDPNHKGKDGCSFSVVQCWGVLPGRRYLLWDQWRGRVHWSMFLDQIREMKSKYDPQVILIEDNGPALELQSHLQTSRCEVELIAPHDDKLTRLRRHVDLFHDRQIVVRAGAPFTEELIVECETFPYGPSDDLVDAATQFFDWIRSNDISCTVRPPRAMGTLGNPRQTRTMLYWIAGRPRSYFFSRR